MRLLEILFFLLKNNSKITTKELAEKFCVSIKTIQRDLDKLSILGIPIISYRGINGGIELDKNYIIAKYILTDDDYKDLILSLYISENIIYGLKKTDLIEKFRLVDRDKCTKILNDIKDNFIIDLDEKKSIDDLYYKIDNAIKTKQSIKLDFLNLSIDVLPISFVLKNEGLYLYCYSDKYRLISIEKISNITKSEKKLIDENFKIVPYKLQDNLDY